jgi:hypothetical protein
MGLPGVHTWLPYVVMTCLTVFVLLRAGSTKVVVGDEELRVGKAHIPLSVLGEVEVIPRAAKQKAMGPQLDPAAYVLHRGWIGPMLKVKLHDPHDPTPYWLFSVQSADRVAKILRQRIADKRQVVERQPNNQRSKP